MTWEELRSHPLVQQLIELALREDIGTGDLTTQLCVDAHQSGRGLFIARQQMIVAGTELLPAIYEKLGGVEQVEIRCKSGQPASKDDIIASVRGYTRTLLTAERVALNFLQRLSGIATHARRYAEAVAGTGCKVLDTRKTTPGLRLLEKAAAAAGGVQNHRMGLYDAILIKNNHIAAVSDLRRAIQRAKKSGKPVEVEVRTQTELDIALSEGVDRVLLDNVSPKEAERLVQYIRGRVEVELSGGITLENIRDYARTGADYISCGSITHSATAVNINFRLDSVS